MKKDGGSAFPREVPNYGKEAITVNGIEIPPGNSLHESGMTLRDYFAGLAMQSFYAGRNSLMTSDKDLEADAHLFYRIADAMLKAREVGGE